MTERELTQVLKSIEAAIEIFQTHKGALSAREISVKSMLHALQNQIRDQLAQQRSGART